MVGSNTKSLIVDQFVRTLEEEGVDFIKVLDGIEYPEFPNDRDPGVGQTYINTTENRLTQKVSDDPLEIRSLSSPLVGDPLDLTYVTYEDEPDLDVSKKHQDITGGRLHEPKAHDNAKHVEEYAVDGNTQPPEGHDNTAHLETYAVDGDTQPPESHDNTAHTNNFILVSAKGEAGGVAELDSNTKVPNSQIPEFTAVAVFTVADSTERLSLNEADLDQGDIAIETDVDEAYIYLGGDPSLEENWSRFTAAEAPVDSVFGRTGNVTAESGDYTYTQIGGTHGNEDHDSTYIVGVEVQDSGVTSDAETVTLNFSDNLSVTQTSSGVVDVDATGGDGGGVSESKIQAVARRT